MQWQASKEQQAEAIAQASLSILRKNLAQQSFLLTLLNIGATNFSAPINAQRGMPKAFKSFFGGPSAQHPGSGAQQATNGTGAPPFGTPNYRRLLVVVCVHTSTKIRKMHALVLILMRCAQGQSEPQTICE